MAQSTIDKILPLDDHPDAEILREFDHPQRSLKRWAGVLSAKAWIGEDLACFFAEAESGADRIVLVFKATKGYLAGIYGGDMRHAPIGSIYEVDVFVTAHFTPIVDRIERRRAFT